MSAPTRADALGSRKEGSMDSLDDWEELNPPSAPDSDDEREPLAFLHKSSGMCVEPRRASSPAAPETPTRFSAGPFARVDSSSNSNVADDFEDLDAGVISRFPPRHSASYEQRPGPGMGNDHDHPSGVDQWLKLAEESLTAGASRAASDLVALLAAVKRGSTAKARLPGEDDPRLAGENLADTDAPGGIFSREISAPAPRDDDWRALVRSLGPATRFFLPAAIAAIAAIVILACVARGPAAGSHGTAGHSASIAAPAPPAAQPRDVGATQLARRIQPDCPARLDAGDDHERRVAPSMPELPARDDDDDDARAARDDAQLCAGRLLGREAEHERLQTQLSLALRDVAELETRLAESIASSEQLRRDVDEQAREKSVWKRSSERWYDAYQREREERERDEAAKKSSWTRHVRDTTALARRALGHVARYGGDA